MIILYGTKLYRNVAEIRKFSNLSRHIKDNCICSQYMCLKETVVTKSTTFANPLIHNKHFHTSPRRFIPPIILIIWKPIIRGFAMLTGWFVREWWRELSPEKKKRFLSSLWKNRLRIAVGTTLLSSLFWIYYYDHQFETPITKRKRFLALTPEQFRKIVDIIYEEQLQEFRTQLLPKTHHKAQRVARVAHRLLNGNKDIKELYDKEWAITVVDSPVCNAFALPNGQIFVFTGMLEMCTNDDQLGGILAHEMAHCILGHGVEQVSFVHLLDWIAIIFIAAIWAFLPSNTLAIFTHWLFNKVTVLLFHLPYNRKLESEADSVSLLLSAKACLDVREISALWTRIALTAKVTGEELVEVEWLSTHPSHEKRSSLLDEQMEEALKLRNSYGCPILKEADPRVEVAKFKETVEKYMEQKAKEQSPDNVILIIKKPIS